MSQFNEKLDQARDRHKRLYLAVGVTVPVILLLIVALLVVSRGTRIEIMPQEAKEHAVIRVAEGLAFSLADTVYSLRAHPVIRAAAPGFRDAVQTIDATFLGKVLPLTLVALPGRLVLDIAGDAADLARTAWRIDGREVILAEKLDVQLDAGAYTITIDHPFFQLKEVAVAIKRGEETKEQVDLQPVAGMLHVVSHPSGATVFLDQEKVGKTPLHLDRNGGRYDLRVAAANSIETQEQVSITRAEPQVHRNYQLELQKSRVHLELLPRDGTLLVNGVVHKGTGAEALVLDATKEYRLTYRKAGYYPATETVVLGVGEEKRLSFHLKEELGRVEFVASPPASIWIGGKNLGLSPVTLTLPAVAQAVTFKKPGYRSVVKTIQPRGSSVQKVSVTLQGEYQARLQEAPREYTSHAGIKLKLFAIEDDLIMGAPRSEKGMRANEFLRKIRLTRPFYVGLYEITTGQFAQFKPGKGGGSPESPVTSVSWQEAAAFCNWLSEKEKLDPFYKIAGGRVTGFDAHTDGYRLLSEAEWEWLARKAGKEQQTIFTWGNATVIPPRATNAADESAQGQVRFYVPKYRDGFSGVAPVGSFTREPSGLYDMAGNVSEWVHDVYSLVPPPQTTAINPLGSQAGDAHVIKGAGWRSGTITTLRPAFREGLSAGRDDVGFRIGRYLASDVILMGEK
ncbi:SUMF1/EgtB/PvdO family nonheme iron enzyme [Desulfocastanea catecholica]